MTVQEHTITELTATDITRWSARPTHASVANSRKELTKKAAAIKKRYDPFPQGTLFGIIRRQHDCCGVSETRPLWERIISCLDSGGLFCQIFPRVFNDRVHRSRRPPCDVRRREFCDGVFSHRHDAIVFLLLSKILSYHC